MRSRKATASAAPAAAAKKGPTGTAKRGTGARAAAPAAVQATVSERVGENAENDVMDEDDNMVTDEDQKAQQTLDVQYNPELLTTILADLERQVQIKCMQIQKDADFMATSIKQAFHLELIKLPTQVKQMSLARFRSEFGDSLEAVTRGAIGGAVSRAGAPVPRSATKSTRASTRGGAGAATVFATPSQSRSRLREERMSVAQTPSRNPREGEMLLSANGSPLGEFQTVVKAARPAAMKAAVPATPGLFVPLQTGEVLDIESANIETMSHDVKQEALKQMQEMMANMAAIMAKLSK